MLKTVQLKLMHGLMINLTLFAFLLMYSHQAIEHVGHCHDDDHPSLSSNLTHNTHIRYDSVHNHHFGCDSADHDHDMHQHFSEFYPKNIKPCRKTADCVTVAYVKHASPDHVWDFVRHILPHSVGTQINSSIPLYLRAQSFLI